MSHRMIKYILTYINFSAAGPLVSKFADSTQAAQGLVNTMYVYEIDLDYDGTSRDWR